MCRSLEEGGRRCKVHARKTYKEILEDAPAELEDHKPANGSLSIRVSETTARETADMPGPMLAAAINTPVEEEPFDVASYLQRSSTRVAENRERLTVKRNVYLEGGDIAALEYEASVLGLPVTTLAQMKIAGDDVYAHAPTMGKNAREDREVWMSIPLAVREAVAAERGEADQEVQAAERAQALIQRVLELEAQGEAAVRARRKELEFAITARAGSGSQEEYEAVGHLIRESRLLRLSLEGIQEKQKEAKRELDAALAKRQASWDRALSLMTIAAAVLPRRTRPFSNAFIMGFSTVARMQRGA